MALRSTFISLLQTPAFASKPGYEFEVVVAASQNRGTPNIDSNISERTLVIGTPKWAPIILGNSSQDTAFDCSFWCLRCSGIE